MNIKQKIFALENKIGNSEKNQRICYAILGGSILLCAIFLRIPYLGDTSLWYDEAIYANNSFADFENFINNTRNINSSPIFLPFLYWIFGDLIRTPLLIRVMPLIFSVLSVYVLLNLYRVGLSRWISFTSALWIALLPVQIRFAQEVREYSLAVFASSLLIFYFLKALQQIEGKKFPYGFCILLFFIPFLSYGNIFIAAVLLAILLFLQKKNIDISMFMFFSFIFCLAMWLSYIFTAKYQMGLAKLWYLASYYPGTGTLFDPAWLASANKNYLDFLLGSPSGLAIILCIVLIVPFFFLVIKKRYGKFPEFYLILAALSLVFLSNILAIRDMYPFGGIRQHLFAAPLLIVAIVSAGLWSVRTWNKKAEPIASFVLFIAFLVPWTVSDLSSAYEEQEDIVAAISDIHPQANDQSVYIFPESWAAVLFHYPERKFYFPRSHKNDIKGTVREIQALPGCQAYLLFTRTFRNQDVAMLSALTQQGAVVILDKSYVGARLVLIDRCSNTKQNHL